MFSALPAVLRVSTVMPGSASWIAAANASPYTGNPPPGVAVPRVTVMGPDDGCDAHEHSRARAMNFIFMGANDTRKRRSPSPLGEGRGEGALTNPMRTLPWHYSGDAHGNYKRPQARLSEVGAGIGREVQENGHRVRPQR